MKERRKEKKKRKKRILLHQHTHRLRPTSTHKSDNYNLYKSNATHRPPQPLIRRRTTTTEPISIHSPFTITRQINWGFSLVLRSQNLTAGLWLVLCRNQSTAGGDGEFQRWKNPIWWKYDTVARDKPSTIESSGDGASI
ncbi:hypothetical protein ACP275_14G322100 [Erythranthe tilingii]